jgi:hypothetical protein
MDAAKEQAAMEQKWPADQAVTDGSAEETNCLEYVKGNTKPTCPSGGTITWNNVGTNPSCDSDGHVLPN